MALVMAVVVSECVAAWRGVAGAMAAAAVETVFEHGGGDGGGGGGGDGGGGGGGRGGHGVRRVAAKHAATYCSRL